MKKILVVGGEFSNKGAELMIHSARKQIREHFPESQLYLAPTLAPLEKIKESGFLPLNFPLFHVGYKTPRAFDLSLKYPLFMKQYVKLRKWAEFEGDVELMDIDIVFDISGYAFADKWGMTPLVNVNTLMKHIIANDGKYIFLPQAFGPFKENQIPVIRECIDLCTLVIARDKVSYENLKSVTDNTSKIKQYSDITLSMTVDSAKKKSTSVDYCCIVPNVRMLDRGGVEWQKEYISLLKSSIEYILSNSTLEIKLVNHSKTDDKELVNELGDMYASGTRVTMIFEEDPLLLKGILGNAFFNLASRFHAVASSLSGNIPCVMTAWSHKYYELAQDFGVEKYCLQEPDFNTLDLLLDDMLDTKKNKTLRKQITAMNNANVKRNREMWATIKKYTL